MNSHYLPATFVFALALAAAGCSSSPMSRIDDNRAKYESWPVDVQEAVLNGQVQKGMTPEQVEMALGKPSQVIARSGKPGEDEIWVYKKGGSGSPLPTNTSVGVGTNVGGVGVGTRVRGGGGRGRRQQQQGSQDEEIVFANGVVVRTDAKAKP